MSREHYFSRSISPEMVGVAGFPWLEGKEKWLPRDRIYGRVLCAHHNKQLSPLDAYASEAFDTIEAIFRVLRIRQARGRSSNWHVIAKCLNGVLFERWLLKVALGFICTNSKNRIWLQNGATELEPPLSIVQAAFGIESLPAGMGLYSDLTIEPPLPLAFEKHVGVEVLLAKGAMQGIPGVFIFCKGLRYRLWLTDKTGYRDRRFRRPGQQVVLCEGQVSHVIQYDWTPLATPKTHEGAIAP